MKIELTHEEAQGLATDQLRHIHSGFGNSVESVTIAPQNLPPNMHAQIDLMALVEAARQATPSGKIPAIKQLREIAARSNINIGLGDAKRFVEFFLNFNFPD
jgi:hypothetical protein